MSTQDNAANLLYTFTVAKDGNIIHNRDINSNS